MTDNTQFLKMIERMIKAGARRVGSADEADLEHFYQIRSILDEAIKSAILAQLAEGKSWSSIGLALGISRQAAFKKYGGK